MWFPFFELAFLNRQVCYLNMQNKLFLKLPSIIIEKPDPNTKLPSFHKTHIRAQGT